MTNVRKSRRIRNVIIPGHFKCACEQGYKLDADGRFCKAEGDEHYIIFANKKSIRGIHQVKHMEMGITFPSSG